MSLIRIFKDGEIIAVADFLSHKDAQDALQILSRGKPEWTFKLTSQREIIRKCTQDESTDSPEVVKERTNKGE